MKREFGRAYVSLSLAAAISVGGVQAVTLTWDADSGTSGAQDGSGAWSTADAAWWNGAANAVWSDGSDAVIGSAGGAAGTVTLSAASVKPNSVTFNAAGSGVYAVNAASPYQIDLNAGTRVFTVNASAAALACGATNGALTKLGAGSLVLSGPTALSGLQINGGSVVVATNLTVAGAGGVFYLGNASAAYSGVLTLSTGAALRVTGTFSDAGVIGRDGGSGTVIQDGGLFRWAPSDNRALYIGAAGKAQPLAQYALNGGTLDLAGNVLGVGLGVGAGTITGVLVQTGGVVTNVGALRLGADGAAGTGAYTLSGGALIVGAGGITSQSGKYAITLGGGSVGASASWSSTLNMTLTNLAGPVMFDTAGSAISLYGALAGSGGLGKKGTGTLSLTNANSYSGGTTVFTGDVSIAHSSALGGGKVSVGNSARLLLNGSINVTNALSLGSEAPSYNNQLLSASGNNLWSGPVTVSGSSIAAAGGSTLRITNGIAGSSYCSFSAIGQIVLDTRPLALTNQTVYFGGNSAGTIRLNVGNNIFYGANLWGGVTLVTGVENALPTNMNLTANNSDGGKLDLSGYNQTIGTLSQNSTYVITVTNSGAPAVFTVNQSANTVFAGRIGGSLTLVKKGTGTLTLTNATTFTGGAIVSNGTLRLGLPNALPAAGAVDVAGGVLDLGGHTVTNGAVTVRNSGGVLNGTLAASVVELVGTGSVRVAVGGSGGLLKSGTGTANVISPLAYAGATEVAAGTLRLDPLPMDTVAFYGFDSASELGQDLSAKGNALKTLTGTPQYSASGRFGGSLYLNGASTLGTLSGAFPVGVPTGAAPYTVSAFVKADAGCPLQGGWIGYGNQANSQANNFRLGGTYTNVWNYWWANDFGAALPSGSFTDGWHSVVGTWDGATERLYIDGVERSNRTPGGLNVGTSNFVIGRTIGDANFKGWVDEVLIASRALSANEISTLHASGAFTARSLPSATALRVAAGATMDLNGARQTVASLSGGGAVTGGVLTVTARVSAGDSAGALGTLAANSGLTLAAGVTNAVDCTPTSADAVNVRGALTLVGGGTVEVTLSDPRHPPAQVTLFTFDALSGGGNLSGWSITGVPSRYSAKLAAQANSITLTISRIGTLVTVR